MRSPIFDLQIPILRDLLKLVSTRTNLPHTPLEQLGMLNPEQIQLFEEHYHLLRMLNIHLPSLFELFLQNPQNDHLIKEDFYNEVRWAWEKYPSQLLDEGFWGQAKALMQSATSTSECREKLLVLFRAENEKCLLEASGLDFSRLGFVLDNNRFYVCPADLSPAKLKESFVKFFQTTIQVERKIKKVVEKDTEKGVEKVVEETTEKVTEPLILDPEVAEFVAKNFNQKMIPWIAQDMLKGLLPLPDYTTSGNFVHFYIEDQNRCVIDHNLAICLKIDAGVNNSTLANLSINHLERAEIKTRFVVSKTENGIELGIEFCRLDAIGPELFTRFIKQLYYVSTTFLPSISGSLACNWKLTESQSYIAEAMTYINEVESLITAMDLDHLLEFQILRTEKNHHLRQMSLVSVLVNLLRDPNFVLGKSKGEESVKKILDKGELIHYLSEDALCELASHSKEIGRLILQKRRNMTDDFLRKILLFHPTLYNEEIKKSPKSLSNDKFKQLKHQLTPRFFIQLLLSANHAAFRHYQAELSDAADLKKTITMIAPFELQLLSLRMGNGGSAATYDLAFGYFDELYRTSFGREKLQTGWLRDYFANLFEESKLAKSGQYRDKLTGLVTFASRTPQALDETRGLKSMTPNQIHQKLVVQDQFASGLGLFYRYLTNEKNIPFPKNEERHITRSIVHIPLAHLAMFLMQTRIKQNLKQETAPAWMISLIERQLAERQKNDNDVVSQYHLWQFDHAIVKRFIIQCITTDKMLDPKNQILFEVIKRSKEWHIVCARVLKEFFKEQPLAIISTLDFIMNIQEKSADIASFLFKTVLIVAKEDKQLEDKLITELDKHWDRNREVLGILRMLYSVNSEIHLLNKLKKSHVQRLLDYCMHAPEERRGKLESVFNLLSGEHLILILMQSRLQSNPNSAPFPDWAVTVIQDRLKQTSLEPSSQTHLWIEKPKTTLRFLAKCISDSEDLKPVDYFLLQTLLGKPEWKQHLQNDLDQLLKDKAAMPQTARFIINLPSALCGDLSQFVIDRVLANTTDATLIDEFCNEIEKIQQEFENGSGNNESVYVLFHLLIVANKRVDQLRQCKRRFYYLSENLPSRLLAYCQQNKTNLRGEMLLAVFLIAGSEEENNPEYKQFREDILRDKVSAISAMLGSYPPCESVACILEDLILFGSYNYILDTSIPSLIETAKTEIDAIVRAVKTSERYQPMLNKTNVVPLMLKYCLKYAYPTLETLIDEPSMDQLRDGLWSHKFVEQPCKEVLDLIVIALHAEYLLGKGDKLAGFIKLNPQHKELIEKAIRTSSPIRRGAATETDQQRVRDHLLRLYVSLTLHEPMIKSKRRASAGENRALPRTVDNEQQAKMVNLKTK